MKCKVWLMLALTTFTGCKVGPEHCLPPVSTPEEWKIPTEQVNINEDTPTLHWWKQLNDPFLNHYIPLVMCRNHDARIAYAKVCEAFALRRMTSSRLLPEIDGKLQYNRAKPAGGVLTPASSSNGAVTAGIPLNLDQTIFIAAFDTIWEFDLFGRIQREIESAHASYLMEKDARNMILISILSEFAKTYLQARGAQIKLELVGKEVSLLEREIQLRAHRVNKGLDREVEVATLRSNLAQLRSSLPQLSADAHTSFYHLSVLLGELPDFLIDELKHSRTLPETPDALSVGIPSELLRRRPDIRQAEHNIARATAEVGIATADLFPHITFSGRYGYEYLKLGMTRGEGETWGYGGDLLTPIFHGGKLRANLQRNRWIRKEAFLSYEQTVLKALEETQSTLLRFVKAKEAEKSLLKSYKENAEVAFYNNEQFNNGLINEIPSLQAQRNLIISEKALVDGKVQSGIQFIALYKALGGCWD